ncbi:NERD domain-containing protein [Sporosarcina sp. FA9]|uniref:NERD domain-containing protein n=1 Tax=Sporosarcina sp. FA9 TaxID=3413030 RepID=UPI003F65A321
MAQLVKLLDYISRYENDLTRYPTQFIRLKKYQWDRMKIQWESGLDHSAWQKRPEEIEPEEENRFAGMLKVFRRKNSVKELEETIDTKEDDENFGFEPNIIYNPTSVAQLRKLYLDQLFHFQIKWASSTLIDKSRVDSKYMRDSLLRSFALNLPDNYLLFYYPIIRLKNAIIDLEILIFTPVECMCISVIEDEDVAAFIGSGDRFWLKKVGETETKILNPFIGLDRMEKVVSSIFNSKGIDFPIRKYLISRNGYIDYPETSFNTQCVDRRTYEKWFTKLQKSSTPMKSNQFKAAEAVLDLGQTTAMSRLFESEEEV